MYTCIVPSPCGRGGGGVRGDGHGEDGRTACGTGPGGGRGFSLPPPLPPPSQSWTAAAVTGRSHRPPSSSSCSSSSPSALRTPWSAPLSRLPFPPSPLLSNATPPPLPLPLLALRSAPRSHHVEVLQLPDLQLGPPTGRVPLLYRILRFAVFGFGLCGGGGGERERRRVGESDARAGRGPALVRTRLYMY